MPLLLRWFYFSLLALLLVSCFVSKSQFGTKNAKSLEPIMKFQGEVQVIALYGMLFLVAALIIVVSLFAYLKPEALLRTFAADSSPEMQSVQEFCKRISGHWWERIFPGEPSAISFLEIRPDKVTNTVKMIGKAYTKDGELAANWESVASCIDPGGYKVFYYWKGLHPVRPKEPFEGLGEISFREFSGQLGGADGVFSDTNLTDMESTRKKSVEFKRSTGSKLQVMKEGNDAAISEMVRKKLKG